MKTANQPLLSLKGITKRFGPLTAVAGVDLDVCPGEIVVIIGPSGSGKSTLLCSINFLEEIEDGTILSEDFFANQMENDRIRSFLTRIL
jgi:polar amino acid transport system ATP-binding protein